jgi:type III secretory pathway component EscR
MHRYLSVLLLSTALIVPVVMRADDDHRQTRRYYDKNARDWHEWNENEDHSYHQYLQDNHKRDHDFSKASSRERNDYFKYRHAHPDTDRQ